MMELTKDLLHELFEYKEGKLYWKITKSIRVKKGMEAGVVDNTTGYRRVGINGRLYRIHRIIYLMYYGTLPEILDHIDGDKLNNRIENLRAASASQNAHNSKLRVNNTSGVKGVSWDKESKKWIAMFMYEGKQNYLGLFSDLAEAKLAVINARTKQHGEYARHE